MIFQELVELPPEIQPNLGDAVIICPTFSKFSFTNWSLESEEDTDASESDVRAGQNPIASNLVNEDHAFDMEAAQQGDPDDIDTGSVGGFFGDDINDVNDDEDPDSAEHGPKMIKSQLPHIKGEQLWQHIAINPKEYSYFDTGALKAWAGPKHWHFSKLRTANRPRLEGSSDKKKRKDKETITFEEYDAKDGLAYESVEKAMSVPKKSVKLVQNTMSNWDSDRLLLPEDLHYSGGDFLKLEGFKKWTVLKEVAKAQSVEGSVQDYDYDNLNDSVNFCPDVGDELNSYPENADSTKNEGGGFSNIFSQTMGEENGDMFLVDAPNRVEKIQIGYAKQAKKVDMRKLKSVEWSILENSIRPGTLNDSDKENNKSVGNNEEDSMNTNDEEKSCAVKDSIDFTEMYKSLKKPNALPSKMAEALSVPLAFVGLLHLCNEQTLSLTGRDDFSDITIRKG